MALYNTLKILMDDERSALVIGDSIKLVEKLNFKIKQIAQQRLKGSQLEPFQSAIVYKRDSQKFIYADGTIPLPPRTIIFATNLAGRGTDIKISSDLEASGGLHVIVAFLPANIRIEEQAFGRAARCGEPGTAQIIIYDEKGEKNIFKLKEKRNNRENERIKAIKEYYHSKIKLEERCLADFKKELEQFETDLAQKNVAKEYREILRKDAIDQYALELDTAIFFPKWTSKMKDFSDNIKDKYIEDSNGIILPLQPSNILKYATKLAFDKEIDKAITIFKDFDFPEYLAEAKYFSAIYNIKKRNELILLDSLEEILIEAKNGFIERLKIYAANTSMTDLYHIVEDAEIFYYDDFQQQQRHCEYFTLAIIETIDQFLGEFCESTDFICESLNQEASMLVYENLSNYSNPPIIGYRVCKNYDDKKLKEYCQQNGTNFENVKANLRNGQVINKKIIQKIFDIKNQQEFWEILKSKNLITNFKTEFFIDSARLSPLTEEVIRNSVSTEEFNFEGKLLEFPFVKEWKRLSSTKDIQKDIFQSFETNRIIQKTEFGTLVNSILVSDLITVEDICNYGISKENSEEIFIILENNGTFIKHPGKSFYRLSPEFSSEKFITLLLPIWCQSIMKKFFKKKFAYVFAYQKSLNNQHFQLSDIYDRTIFCELIELGILESNNVNIKALDLNVPGGDIVDKTCGFLLGNDADQHFHRALRNSQNVIKKTFTKSKHFEKIISKDSKEHIENVLKEKASVKEKYESVDINFISLTDVLNKFNLEELKVKAVTHSLPYLINPCEMRWSKKTLITLGVVGSGAAIQLATGIGLTIATFGIGAFAGKFLINEGISDAYFCAKTIWNGKSGNFLRHKTTNMALNIALCGITEPIKLLPTTAIKVIKKADVFVSGGGGILKTLIPIISKMEKHENTRNLIVDAIDFTTHEILTRFILILENTFRNTENLKACLIELFKKMGLEKDIENDGNLLERAIHPLLTSMFSYIVGEVNKKCIKSSSIHLMKYSIIITAIMESQKFQQYLTSINQNLSNGIEKIYGILKKKVEEKNSTLEMKIEEEQLSQKANEVIEEWKKQLEKKYKKLLKERVQQPLNELNNMNYQNRLQEIRSATLKKAVHKNSKEMIKHQNLINTEKFSLKFKTEYNLQLEIFLNKTKDLETFIIFALSSSKHCLLLINALEKLISNKLNSLVFVEVELEDGSIIAAAASATDYPKIKPTVLHITQENGSSSISSIFDQIIQQIPEVKFDSYTNFKSVLIEIIKEHGFFQQ